MAESGRGIAESGKEAESGEGATECSYRMGFTFQDLVR